MQSGYVPPIAALCFRFLRNAAVLSFGGVLGIGEKLFAVPWNALKLDTVNKRFILDIDKDRLNDAPGFDKDAWPRMADQKWATQVHSYYKAKPYWE